MISSFTFTLRSFLVIFPINKSAFDAFSFSDLSFLYKIGPVFIYIDYFLDYEGSSRWDIPKFLAYRYTFIKEISNSAFFFNYELLKIFFINLKSKPVLKIASEMVPNLNSFYIEFFKTRFSV